MRALYCVAAFLLLLPAACGGGNARQGEQPAEDESVPERVSVEELAAGDAGLEEPQVLVAASAAELAEASGVEVPEEGDGLYVAAHAGERPTGGHSVEVEAAGPEGDPAELRVSVSEPGPGDIATQALTYPYAVVHVRPAPPDGSLSFVDGEGGELGWPVRPLSG